MNIPPYEQFVITVREAWRYKKQLSFVFLLTVVLVLTAGALKPKKYISSATLLLETDSVMTPLMKERAVLASSKDWVRDAKEKILVREVLLDVVNKTDWNVEGVIDSSNVEKFIKQVKHNTRVSGLGKNSLLFSYEDTDPRRAFEVTQNLVEAFILLHQEESRQKSREAFDFISDQVNNYHSKLKASEERLRVFKTEKFEGTIGGVGSRISNLEQQLEAARIELSENQFKRKSLKQQLDGESTESRVQELKNNLKKRVIELEKTLDNLRLSYHDSYPDIVSIKVQIGELEKQMAAVESGVESPQASGRSNISNTDNILLQQIRSEISKVESSIEAQKVRIRRLEDLLAEQKSRSERIHENEAELSELTRDYNVNKDIYQDLLMRRENARVSMNIEIDQKGANFKIISPATIPQKPSGASVMHFWLAAPLAGMIIPLGLIYAMIMFDQRIRYRYSLSEFVDAPVLTSIPKVTNPSEALTMKKDFSVIAGVFCLFLIVYFGFAALKIMEVI
ncbi:MAG TPA: XrtA system polysaccharide chain length determinant [Pseudomonadales bacterium]